MNQPLPRVAGAAGGIPRDIAVVGAGIVGMSAALYLQRDGHRVTVYDPNEPGSGTSFGNAGSISTQASLPNVTPGVLWRVPKMLRDPYGPLVIRPAYLPSVAGWLIKLALATRPAKITSTSNALGSLLDLAEDAYRPLLRLAKAEDLVRSPGRLMLYSNDAAYARGAQARAEWKRRGIRFEELGVREVLELEPALAPVFKRAVFMPDSSVVINPHALVQRFASAFVQAGGRIVRQAVSELRRVAGHRHVITNAGSYPTDLAIVAAGSWSKPLCDRLGIRIPLESERGYHLMFPALTRPLTRGVLTDKFVHLVPMAMGVRLTSGVEFAGLNAPPDFRRIYRIAQLARELLPELGTTPTSEWLGFRPSLPDALPVIGSVPGHEDLILCFGHQHIGLTLGPISGKIVADLVAGRDPPVDTSPFRVHRSFFH